MSDDHNIGMNNEFRQERQERLREINRKFKTLAPAEMADVRDENERLQSELTAARDEAERLRAQLSDMTGCACDAESLCKYHAMTTTSGRSIILRKQAEAIERLASHYSIKSMSGNYIWKEAAIEEATRLRDQADSLENGE